MCKMRRTKTKRRISPPEAVQKARHKLDLAQFHSRELRSASTKPAVRDPEAIEAYLTAALGAGASVFYTLHEGFGPTFEDRKRRLSEEIGEVEAKFFYRMIGYRGQDVHLSFLDASYKTDWKPPHEVRGVTSSAPPGVLMENPDPAGQPRFAQAWVGLPVPVLDGVFAYEACEQFLEMLKRLIQICEEGLSNLHSAGGTTP